MDWKIGLDKYLTSSPDDKFDNWSDDVLNNLTNTFYDENEDWIVEYDGQCNKWLNELFRRGKDTIDTSLIIERAFKIYYKK
jgi:hypothetical protein